jgi:hypothetical protein
LLWLLLLGLDLVVAASTEALEAVDLVPEVDQEVMDLSDRDTLGNLAGHHLLSHLVVDKSLSDHPKARFVSTS